MDNTFEKLQKYLGNASNAKVFLEVLARDKQFEAALETPIGVELLMDIVKEMKALTEMILNDKDDENVRAELKAYRKILGSWSKRIASASSAKKKFNTITQGDKS